MFLLRSADQDHVTPVFVFKMATGANVPDWQFDKFDDGSVSKLMNM